MRTNQLCVWMLVGAVSLALVGCASHAPQEVAYGDVPPPSDALANTNAPAPAVESAPAAPASPDQPATSPPLIVTPDNTLEGSVVSVNEVGRFAVLKFPIGRLPVPESTMFVYRQGQKVGELKVSGLQKERKDDLVVADIREGDCRVADVARDR